MGDDKLIAEDNMPVEVLTEISGQEKNGNGVSHDMGTPDVPFGEGPSQGESLVGSTLPVSGGARPFIRRESRLGEFIPRSSKVDAESPYLVTEECREVSSPYYLVDKSDPGSWAIGLEDKVLWRVDIEYLGREYPKLLMDKDAGEEYKRVPKAAAVEVASYFADRGVEFLDSIADKRFVAIRLRSRIAQEDGNVLARRAVALMKAAAAKGAQLEDVLKEEEDLELIVELDSMVNALIRRLNTNLTEQADTFRQAIYNRLGLKSDRTTSTPQKNGQAGPSRYAPAEGGKITVGKALATLSPRQQRGWYFMRDLIGAMSKPAFREMAEFELMLNDPGHLASKG